MSHGHAASPDIRHVPWPKKDRRSTGSDDKTTCQDLGSLGSHDIAWMQDPRSKGSHKKTICEILPYYQKTLQEAPKIHNVHQKTLISWSKTRLSQLILSEQDPGFPGSRSNFLKTRFKICRVPQKTVFTRSRIHALDLSRKCQTRIQDPSRSQILDLPWILARVCQTL